MTAPVSAAAKRPLPAPSTPIETVLAELQAGRMSHAEFTAWDASRRDPKEGGSKPRKAVCHLTRDQFMAKAPMLSVDFGGQIIKGKPKAFSTGSFGWNITGKFETEIDGVPCTVQVSANAIVCGSKPGEAS